MTAPLHLVRTALIILCSISSLGLWGCNAHAQPAQDRRGRDRLEADATKQIREFTTEPAFSTPWVDHLPESPSVPSPPDYLGYVVGSPNRLTPPDRINAYFRELARTSPRVQVFSLGKSHGGREMIVAAIAEPRLLRQLDRVKRLNKELADPRVTTEARAREIAASIPPIYYITAGLHSPETGPPEMSMELAYRLAVSEQQHIQSIRQGVITLITPVLEMDGRARMVDWFNRHLTEVKDLRDMPPKMAPYWGNYTAHDNNRDGLQQSQPLTRNYTNAYYDYLPVISLDLHESVPLLYVSTGTGPYNEAVDPITVTEWQLLASYEVSEATKLGLRGVWTWGFYTGWYPGYLLWVTNNHNAVGRFYETFGNGHPGTFERELKNSKFADRRTNSRQWYRPWPPEKRVKWSLRNNTNYMQTATLASLQLAAKHGEQFLFNFWKKNKNAIDKGKREAPHALVIPAKQRDRDRLHETLRLLDRHRIEVHRAPAAATVGDTDIAAGDYVIRLDQPYRNLARTLLLAQKFPKTAQHTPYDDVAWSLDLHLGIDVETVDDPSILTRAFERVTGVPELPGSVSEGTRFIVDHRGQAPLAGFAFALRAGGAQVRALAEDWDRHPAGSLIIEGISASDLEPLARKHRLDANALAGEPSARTIEVDVPRVAVFHTWRYTQDSGWLRYTLEQLEVPFTLIDKDDLRAGKLRDAYDVILVPSQGWLDFQGIVHGIDRRWGPLAYTNTPEYPSHGVIDSSPDITGGMGFEGLAHLQRFVEGGGVLVGLGSGGLLASDSGLARRVSTARAQTPGSHVTTRVLRPEHPLAWGYDPITHVFRGNLPVYDVREFDRGMAVMQFGVKTWRQAEKEADRKADIPVDSPKPSDDDKAGSDGPTDAAKPAGDSAADRAIAKAKDKLSQPLELSGVVKKAAALSRKPALLDVPVGRGRVILFSWNPMHRHQNRHDFAFVGNALLFFNDLPETPTIEEVKARDK